MRARVEPVMEVLEVEFKVKGKGFDRFSLDG